MSTPDDYVAEIDEAFARWADELGMTVEELKEPGPLAIAAQMMREHEEALRPRIQAHADAWTAAFAVLAEVMPTGETP